MTDFDGQIQRIGRLTELAEASIRINELVAPVAPRKVAAEAALDVGEALPDGADAVAPVDAVEFRGAAAQALAPVAPGEGVLPRGADAVSGEALRQAGEPIRRTDLAVFAALGV